ncbi:MAG: GDP-mannose 4,6-dehydratase [Candidatus Sungbacteria bacterium RIFCSPLOWO2_01_FULL_54_21]|uniref:GDP-mannose 4,6-dehydratase n=1 Tax=Candidatus Sungbacteria bacterium RIFCSPLOWO2_01_FULL_54_21 TaxID=1802279 RepID=A0A1G2LB33_9BACT|nr:MAG: GDP-mannose 4,6-dehydratase [Candidatus Sungbacteria bacterium RIFCSPLOWO2_01_FULL_54_21]
MKPKQKSALITGICGQDGSYLADFLLAKGYRIFGLERRASKKNRENISASMHNVTFLSGDLLDEASLVHALKKAKPDEVYNLAAQSFVGDSWPQPVYTGEVTGLGVTRILEAVRQVNPKIKFYQASSSEMFGGSKESPQNEKTHFYPRSPYGVAKLYGHWITINYRESYGMFAASGILFNHESPRRGMEFVTRKITHRAAEIKLGLAKELRLGNLDAKRDWGFAGDYVEAMWLMLQQDTPGDYVIGTGITHSVREFVEAAFAHLKLDWKKYVKVDKTLLRPADVHLLLADARRAHKELKWKPKVGFQELVQMMVDADVERLARGQ